MNRSNQSKETHMKRKGAKEGRMELTPVFKEIKRLKISWNKGSDDLKAKSHQAQFPSCEKELKKSLLLNVVFHTFNMEL